jgi:hypothetical protein
LAESSNQIKPDGSGSALLDLEREIKIFFCAIGEKFKKN